MKQHAPVRPLLIAPTLQGGADSGSVDPADDVVNVEHDAVFGDPICGKCAVSDEELLLRPKELPCPKEMSEA